jgi:hypothetical protein
MNSFSIGLDPRGANLSAAAIDRSGKFLLKEGVIRNAGNISLHGNFPIRDESPRQNCRGREAG